jgi:hypothetical protein
MSLKRIILISISKIIRMILKTPFFKRILADSTLSNAENLLILRNKELAEIYIENWYKHKEYSERYEGR